MGCVVNGREETNLSLHVGIYSSATEYVVIFITIILSSVIVITFIPSNAV